ncbi:MAG: L-threonylcarbamoyladenylate synthase [Patescibacteria group bacterium]|nr:L-threonylcarbamoyladenylate synthase [Patescibacteria group bacterium]
MTPALTTIKDKHLSTMINEGSVGVLPTDTLYGLVCRADNKASVRRLYEIKNRDKKPGTIIAATIGQLVSLGIKKRYLTAIAGYWPGPVSVIIPTDNPDLHYLDMGKGTLAVRIVANEELIRLLELTGPLLTSSANMPGKDSANTIDDAQKYFGNRIDFYVNGGDYSERQPSTLIRVIDDTVDILRQGSGIIK